MDAKAKTVQDILHSGDQYLIPYFQRHYSWQQKHWKHLWSDLMHLLRGDSATRHFLGPLVCTPISPMPGSPPTYQLIDGQQRITTLTVLLAALRDYAREQNLPALAEEIHETFLVHKYRKGLQRYKVVPRVGDRVILQNILSGEPTREFAESGLVKAFKWFRKHIRTTIEGESVTPEAILRTTVGRLSLVVITIEGENPYEIFESLNSTGLALEQADLVRNHLFMQVPLTEQEGFHHDTWEPFERAFAKDGEQPEIPATDFYRFFLLRGGDYFAKKDTFPRFKEYDAQRGEGPEARVKELRRFARYEGWLRRPDTAPPWVQRSLRVLQLLEVTTAHPLIYALFDRLENNTLPQDQCAQCVQDLLSFVIRRSICGDSSRPYTRWFPEAVRHIGDDPVENLREHWMGRGWPDDAALQERLVAFPIYRREPKKCRAILEELEHEFGHKEPVDLISLTIEHVLPQTIDKGAGAQWQPVLGPEWKALHERWVHTIGNLTLTGYNPDMSNRPFDEKRRALGQSNVSLNVWISAQQEWTIQSIRDRGGELSQKVARIWSRPAGRAYLPPAEPERREQVGKGEFKALDYWAAAVQRLEGSGLELDASHIRSSQKLRVLTPHAGVRMMAWARPTKRQVACGLEFRGTRAIEVFELLEAERADLPDDLRWEGGEHWRRVLAYMPEGDPATRAHWPVEHTWLRERWPRVVHELLPRVADASGRIQTGDLPWARDGQAWHLEQRCSPETRGWLLELDRAVTAALPVEPADWSQKWYLVYRVNGHNWLAVITKRSSLLLDIYVKRGAFDREDVARRLGIVEYDVTRPLAEKLALPSSVSTRGLGADRARIRIRVKRDLDVDAPALIEFLRDAYDQRG